MQFEKRTVFKDEPFLVTFVCRFSDSSPHMYIDLNPEVEGFRFEKLHSHSDLVDEKRVDTFYYVARAKAAGNYTFKTDILMKQTTEDSIRETTIGRDNAVELEFKRTTVSTPSYPIEVKPTTVESHIAGNFTMRTKWSKQSLKAFEPLQLLVRIQGEGDFKQIKPFAFKIKGVEILANTQYKRLTLEKHGYKGEVEWRYAFVSDKNFTVPAQKISYFDLATHTEKALELKAETFTVLPKETPQSLLDQRNFPAEETPFDYRAALKNLLFFILGAFVLWIGQKIKIRPKKKVEKAKFNSIEAVISYLIAHPEAKYEKLLEEIERDIKDKKVKNLTHYTKEIHT